MDTDHKCITTRLLRSDACNLNFARYSGNIFQAWCMDRIKNSYAKLLGCGRQMFLEHSVNYRDLTLLTVKNSTTFPGSSRIAEKVFQDFGVTQQCLNIA